MFGVDYDALIGTGGEGDQRSVYARAVAADPQLLKDVLEAESPVLAALQVAVGYKPVAEFTQKYGSTPEDIKAAMRAEFEAENAPVEAKPRAAGASPVFSTHAGGRAAPGSAPAKAGLTDVFGK